MSQDQLSDSERCVVLMLNDDDTPMEFVVGILERFFDMEFEAAKRLMFRIHREGRAECECYAPEVAEQKVAHILGLARQYGHPLQCLVQPASMPPQSK